VLLLKETFKDIVVLDDIAQDIMEGKLFYGMQKLAFFYLGFTFC